MSEDTKKTEEKKDEKGFMDSLGEFGAKPVTRKDVAIVLGVVAVGAVGYYGYTKYQANQEGRIEDSTSIKITHYYIQV